MSLQEIHIPHTLVYEGELFLVISREISRTLEQGDPAYLSIMMPGVQRGIYICFPATNRTLIYSGYIHTSNLVAEYPEYSHRQVSLPAIAYRYGMELDPWSFHKHISKFDQSRLSLEPVVNYILLNTSLGLAGVVIRVTCSEVKRDELLEIYSFSDAGRPYLSPLNWLHHPNTHLLARYTPSNVNTAHQVWRKVDEPVNISA